MSESKDKPPVVEDLKAYNEFMRARRVSKSLIDNPLSKRNGRKPRGKYKKSS